MVTLITKRYAKMRDGEVNGISFKNQEIGISNCKICTEGKQTRFPFEHSQRKSNEILQLIHSD